MIKTFVGYDLGDGETIVDRAVVNLNIPSAQQKQDFPGMSMPDGGQPGIAIPTAFAECDGRLMLSSGILQMPTACQNVRLNFKRRPTDLLPKLTESRKADLMNLFTDSKTWPTDAQFPEGNTDAFREFKKNVIRFTNEIFDDTVDANGNGSIFYNTLKAAAFNSNDIVFCVGHPTKWDDLDVTIYKAIFRESILGRPFYAGKSTELVMVAESRAAFLYVKEKPNDTIVPKGKCVLLLDIGSSTIDLTAMSADSRNHIYNSGNNYLGARGIDLIIRDWYLSELKKDGSEWSNYEDLSRANPSIPQALTLACRKAKEQVYSNKYGSSRIDCESLKRLRLTKDDLAQLAHHAPFGPILSQTVSVPAEILDEMGDKPWTALFEEFLCQQKKKMEEEGVEVARIILTGSASRMDFVKPIIKSVFSETSDDEILNDTDPSRTISKGLALAGLANERSEGFQADLAQFIREKLPKIIENNLDDLASPLSEIVAKIIEGIMRKRMVEWRGGEIKTLNDMNDLIKADCEKDKMTELLKGNKEYNETIKGWLTDKVGKDIAAELHTLCTNYGVSNDFTVEDLNIMTMPTVDSQIVINPLEVMGMIVGLVTVISGIIAWCVAEVVLGFLIGIIWVFFTDLGAVLVALLIEAPEIFIPVLGAAAVWAMVKAYHAGTSIKEQLIKLLQGKNLPAFLRRKLTDQRIGRQFTRTDRNGENMHSKMCAKIKAGILAEESKAKLVAEVSRELSKAVERRADDIKYVIEAK